MQPEYTVGTDARPAVEAKVVSSFDEVDLGQFEATWIVTSGNGTVTPPKSPFNSEEKTVTTWKLPTIAGTYDIRADLLDGEGEDMQPPIRFQTKAKECDPTKPQNPVITGYTLSCGGNGILIDVSFKAEGPGVLIGSGSGSCDGKGLCYPVRLSFMRTGIEPDWVIAANGYSASLLSGTVNEGVVRINFSHFFRTYFSNMTPREFLEAGYPKYNWQVQLTNKCNQQSAHITF